MTAIEMPGWAFTWRSTSDPAATAPQKKSVALVPTPPLAGPRSSWRGQLSAAR